MTARAFRQRALAGALLALCLADAGRGQGRGSRRSQRVRMEEVQVASPDGKVRLTVLPNAERLTFRVTMEEATVLEPSAIVMKVDGYDLSAGVVFAKAERYEIDETYPWWGA